MTTIETDYLIIGGGAVGMAFADTIIAETDAHVTIVDRQAKPGGHWNDAYSFVALHQPSAFYGVSSVPLGSGSVDRSGLNAGFHEAAGADELRAYYARVMDQQFLPTGRVTHHPCSDHHTGPDGRHFITSRLSGAVQEVRVRRKWVDTGFLEGRVPATSPPPFEVAEGVRCVAAGDIARLTEWPERYAVIGTGKTALDTCVWLLSQGVSASAIQWVRPREAWWLNRRFHQPGDGLPAFFAGVGLQLKAMAQAGSIDDLFARLEAEGFFLRLDPSVAPTMCRGAIVSEAEVARLRQVEDVVRLGHVRRIERERIVLDGGEVPTSPGTLHVHCAAVGLARPHPRLYASAQRGEHGSVDGNGVHDGLRQRRGRGIGLADQAVFGHSREQCLHVFRNHVLAAKQQRVRLGRPLRIQGLPQAVTGPAFSGAVGLCLFATHPQDEWWDFDIPAEKYPARSLKRAFKWFKDNW